MADKEAGKKIVPVKTSKTTNKQNKSVAKTATKKPAAKKEVAYDITNLIMLAMDKENGLEIIKELTELKNQQEDRAVEEEKRQAKIRFNQDFAQMQRSFEPVYKAKVNKKYGSRYAGVDDLQRQYGPIISENGFSFDFGEPEFFDDGSVNCTFILSKHGYTKKTVIRMPPYNPDKSAAGKEIMNPMQAVGTQLSYGNRYAMKAGLGVTESDDDTDGNFDIMDGVMYGEEIEKVQACNTVKQANNVAKEICETLRAKNDKHGEEIIRRVYRARRNVLEKMQ
jgi:hypothetical protein